MIKNVNWFIVLAAAFFVMSSAFLFSFIERKESAVQEQQLSEHIQLALRRTAHLLLQQAGDSTSTIAPVEQTSSHKYLVKLEHNFNYDSLPVFLQNSFDEYDITDKYDVAVRDCRFEALILGYTSFDFQQKGSVACQGRSQNAACLNFTVTFTPPFTNNRDASPIKSAILTYLLILLVGLMALALAAIPYFMAYYDKSRTISPPKDETPLLKDITDLHLIYIGNTQFDTKNHLLLIEDVEQKLTFQESQLLLLFCQNKNTLLEREFILKTLWGDDGVLITRSVDVFVSRLRKLLKPDASLKIATVHGRGYRFEI